MKINFFTTEYDKDGNTTTSYTIDVKNRTVEINTHFASEWNSMYDTKSKQILDIHCLEYDGHPAPYGDEFDWESPI